jgi:hypothetical protein
MRQFYAFIATEVVALQEMAPCIFVYYDTYTESIISNMLSVVSSVVLLENLIDVIQPVRHSYRRPKAILSISDRHKLPTLGNTLMLQIYYSTRVCSSSYSSSMIEIGKLSKHTSAKYSLSLKTKLYHLLFVSRFQLQPKINILHIFHRLYCLMNNIQAHKVMF